MLDGEDGGKKETRRGSSCVPFWSSHAFLNEFNMFKRLVFGPIPASYCTLCVWRRLYIPQCQTMFNKCVNCDPIPVDNAIYVQTKRIHGSNTVGIALNGLSYGIVQTCSIPLFRDDHYMRAQPLCEWRDQQSIVTRQRVNILFNPPLEVVSWKTSMKIFRWTQYVSVSWRKSVKFVKKLTIGDPV